MGTFIDFITGTGAIWIAAGTGAYLVFRENQKLTEAGWNSLAILGALGVVKAVAYGGDVVGIADQNVAGILTNPHTLQHLGALAYQGLYIP